MPQAILPLIPAGATSVNEFISVQHQEGTCIWFHGAFPVFSHAVEDLKSFRLFSSQLVVNGTCKQRELAQAFGISLISIKRYAKKYREEGPEGFFKPRRGRQGHVLTEPVKARAQALLAEGKDRKRVAAELGIKFDTLRKAIADGRVQEVKKKP